MQGEDKKYEILRMLKEKYPEFISGEGLSRHFGISRTAIWKYVRSLKEEGYGIEASSKIGYRLVDSYIINGCEIASDLGTKIIGKKVLYFDSIDSTSNYAKQIALESAEEGTTVVAGSQSEGRGRLGRKWDSPTGSGIYLSIILRPLLPPENVQGITLAASVAVARAMEKITGIRPGIKWPNDLLLNGRKVCGILTEMNSEMERVNFVVLGIGINYDRQYDEFPAELAGRATSLSAFAAERGIAVKKSGKLEMLRAVLQELDEVYGGVIGSKTGEILGQWKKYSVTLGKEVRILTGTMEYLAVAEDITDDGKLIVKCGDGSVRLIQSGEISIRGVNGYA